MRLVAVVQQLGGETATNIKECIICARCNEACIAAELSYPVSMASEQLRRMDVYTHMAEHIFMPLPSA